MVASYFICFIHVFHHLTFMFHQLRHSMSWLGTRATLACDARVLIHPAIAACISIQFSSYIHIYIHIYISLYILHLYLPPRHLISNRPTSSLLRDPECTQFFSSSKALGSIRSLQKILFHSFCKKATQFL